MNQKFREYAFGRSFNINISDKMVESLAKLVKGDDPLYGLFPDAGIHGLHRRGLVETWMVDGDVRVRWRATKAGALVYDLLVEAGEYSAMLDERREVMEEAWRREHAEWEEKYGRIKIELRDKHRKDRA